MKDRLALGVIEDAERRGLLQPGQTVIEATSGNTGIGLAMVCAQKGYPLVVTMAESFSVERRKLMRFLGVRARAGILALQHETHRDISSPDPLDGFVHSCERHDIDDSRDAMLRREREHLRGIRTTPYVVPIDGSPRIVQ